MAAQLSGENVDFRMRQSRSSLMPGPFELASSAKPFTTNTMIPPTRSSIPLLPANSGRALFIFLSLVCGGSGLMPSSVRAQTPGAVVTSFNPQAGAALDSGDVAQVDAIVEQTDNKILVAGHFDTFAGLSRASIARLNADGSLDKSFNPGTGALDSAATPPTAYVNSLALQSNQDILVAGSFTTFNGVVAPGLVRLKPDGALDTSFAPAIPADGAGAVVAVQTNGKILVAYTEGATPYYITRLNKDGSQDTSFATAVPLNNQVNALAITGDGKILVGGFFTKVNGAKRNFLARLNDDGSVDGTFTPKIVSADTASYGSVYVIIQQPDGKIIVGGHFTSVSGETRGSVARLSVNGKLDTSFDPGTALAGYEDTTFAYSGALQANGQVVIGGRFLTADGVGRKDLARLDADGKIDPTFGTKAGANYSVDAVLLQANGDLLIGGYFTTYAGKIRHSVARIY
jgi:uncharacterized delta-60 repeat protein